MVLGQSGDKMILLDRSDQEIQFCGRKQCWKQYGIKLKENTQIPIFEFEYLKSGSSIFDSVTNG
jgi:hypothetical protein